MANINMPEDTGEDDSIKKFFYHEHASKLLKQLNESRKSPHLCDAQFVFGESRIPVQKCVLTSASPYFRALFDYDVQSVGASPSDTSSTKTGPTVVTLDNLGISEHMFRDILDYIYTAQVRLSADNVQEMLQASDQLLMGDLKTLCCKYLDSCITVHNCIGIFDFTSRLSCSWSHVKVSQFLDENFSEVARQAEFLALSEDRVASFLSCKTIMVHHEDELLDLLLGWYQFEPQTRSTECLNLARQVLFGKQISDNKLLELNNSADGVEKDLCNVIQELKIQQSSMTPIQRGFTHLLVACGGEGCAEKGSENMEVKGNTRCIRLPEHKIQTASNAWVDLAPMVTSRAGHGLVEVAGCLYAAGGRNANFRITNSCEKYQPKTNTWTSVASMNHARVGFGLVSIDNMIYAVGGSNDMTDPLMSMEVYNIFTDKWKPMPDMIVKKAWSCCTAAGKKIYVLGGGIIGKFYESVEVFDTQTFTWYAVAPMRERRCDARAVALANDIYVFGGYRRIECPSAGHSVKLCGSEVYSEKNDLWLPLHSPRTEAGLCAIGQSSLVFSAVCEKDRIIVVGEFDMNGEFHSVRVYDKRVGKWECLVVGVQEQTRYSACLLSIPTHVFYQHLWNQAKLNFRDVLG